MPRRAVSKQKAESFIDRLRFPEIRKRYKTDHAHQVSAMV